MLLGAKNLTSFDTKFQPKVNWYGVDQKSYYTLCLISKY